MSLINDALKRAHESQGKIPGSPPPLIPVTPPSRSGSGWFLPVAIVVLLAAAGFFIWLAFGHKSSRSAAVPAVPAAPVVASIVPPPQPAPAVAPQSSPTNAAVSNMLGDMLPQRWPKVQGIIYTQSQPMAIVDGKMVNVGDQLGHFLVKQITRNDVTFQGDDGEIKQLGIGE